MAASLLALVGKRYHRLNAGYQQWWFRYGQVALRAGRPVPGLARLRADVKPDDDIAPGVMIVQKDAETDRVHLWIGAVLHGQETDTDIGNRRGIPLLGQRPVHHQDRTDDDGDHDDDVDQRVLHKRDQRGRPQAGRVGVRGQHGEGDQ